MRKQRLRSAAKGCWRRRAGCRYAADAAEQRGRASTDASVGPAGGLRSVSGPKRSFTAGRETQLESLVV